MEMVKALERADWRLLKEDFEGPGWGVYIGVQEYRQDNLDRQKTCGFGR